LPSTVEAVVYYAAAEGLTNIAKYAGATAASLRVEANKTTNSKSSEGIGLVAAGRT
jgi:signal transduction histidine kinase